MIGLLGGSFDPPHLGHTLLAAYALGAHPLERLLVVPTYRHAFGKSLTPFDHRLRMCEIAMRDLKRVEVSAIERELGHVSRTLPTVEELERRNPGARFALVLGSDLEREVDAWYGHEELKRRVTFLYTARAEPAQVAPGLPPRLPAIRSRDIRASIAAGRPTSGLLALPVWDYIQQHGLYQTAVGT